LVMPHTFTIVMVLSLPFGAGDNRDGRRRMIGPR
jgi:hypothetical protein